MFNNGNDLVMPVAPMYGGYGGNGNGFLGGDGIWALLLFALIWGNGFGGFGGFGGMGGFAADGAMLYPWMNQAEVTTNGFQNQMLQTTIQGVQNAVTTGFGDVQNSLCSGFAGVNASINGAQNALAQQLYTNQISDLERSFAAQTASTQGMNAIQGQLAQCCCDNRAATADVKYTIATEACADRATSTANTQAILDKLCQLELDGVKREVEAKNDRIADLQNQLNMATMRESQTAQNAFIAQGLSDEVDALYNRLSNCPVPTTPVYGRTPIFTCNGNNGCGCGNNYFG